MRLAFRPGDFGIARHFVPGVKIKCGKGGGYGAAISLEVPWLPGDSSTGLRAAWNVRHALASQSGSEPEICSVQPSPSCSQPAPTIYLLKIPEEVEPSAIPEDRLMICHDLRYLNPTPYHLEANDIGSLFQESGAATDYDLIELTGSSQPLQYPETGNGLYYYLHMHWLKPRENPIFSKGLFVLFGSRAVEQFRLTGVEISYRATFIADNISRLGIMLASIAGSVGKMDPFELLRSGSPSLSQIRTFETRLKIMFPAILSTLGEGIVLAKSAS